ncbi:zf-HC2 domain-containing protein [Verrucomicrobiaceae bacterium R5-34]|uniref:Zf-HC2 domain-containing protein n=1 Tax=Oceaniferula flava TaxID=2800421 RepID=A0AAE2V8K8_9BACT|nr:zf-HC2 domain-containing protein [Oceaniferula flavus]MBK1829452.1 zf-HC2 domain-containing protein [Verrucomicrobiaceae bacterium R5-34]MBK1853678.1 zf-HC2 domain-containing protein [Oceaniferula flavus]MBM1134984.1 zf-HC2 domain-containing protein [Oceaniferula flavus]
MNNHSPPPPPLSYRLMQRLMWPVLKVLGMSCKSTYELCSTQMDRKLSFSESLRLRLHLLICSSCRHLPAQFKGLKKLVHVACDHDSEPHLDSTAQLTEESKDRIRESLSKKP